VYSRHLLSSLVFALPVLVLVLAVVLGGSGLARALGDAALARGLAIVAAGALVLLVCDVLALLTLLGLRALDEDRRTRLPPEN
jgi:hypothetical protein